MKIAHSLIFLIAGLILFPMTVHGACSVATTAVNFGAYNPLGSIAVDSTGTITVSCDDNTQVSIAIGPSGNSGGFNPRKLLQTSGSDLLNYNLYTTSSERPSGATGRRGLRHKARTC